VKELSLNDLLSAYAVGIFPMAEDRDDPDVFWVDPEERGILPLDSFHIPKKLRKLVRADRFAVRCDAAFMECVLGCAEPAPGRARTWINDTILNLYAGLHARGFAHSVECWSQGRLCGGLYGVSLGGAFFGESMFSRETDASKVALVHLVGRLKAGNYQLLDTQFVTDHLRQFGAIGIPRSEYKARLSRALQTHANFYSMPAVVSGSDILQSITQTS